VANEETIDHLSFWCPFTVRIWMQLAVFLKLTLPQLPPTVNLLLSTWRYTSINKRDKVLWDLTVAVIFGGI